MSLLASNVGVALVFGIFVMLLPVALLVVLQVWLCKKGKWLGLILPCLSLLMSLLLVFSVVAFQRMDSGTLVVTDEHGQVIQEHSVEHHSNLTPGAAGTVAGLFLVSNIPTVVFGGIWLHYKNRHDFQEDMNRMKIEDLE
ncbi:MAG: hypothetical protein ACOX7N_07150 [Lawsonibacter sp.]|jgi:hypothetical protein